MTAGRPDFTDVFYAKAMIRVCVTRGLRLQEERQHRFARAAYREAVQWEQEEQRLAALVRANPFPWSKRHNR